MDAEGVMEEVLTDDQSHYEISLTAGQAFVAFVLLLLSLAASFAFGLLIGRGATDEHLALRKDAPVITETVAAAPKKVVADEDFKEPPPPSQPRIEKVASVGPTSVGRPAEAGLHTFARGREQYQIYCTPCHGAHGHGDGVIVKHGFPRPPDLAGKTPGDVINAIAFGKGAMYSIPDADAQSIAWYIQSFR